MEPNTQDSGMRALMRDVVKESKFGQMARYTKVIGRMIEQREEED